MIIYSDKGYETRSDKPDSDWAGEALYVVPDGSELAEKIKALYPYYDFILDEAGQLIDVEATERPEEPDPQPTAQERIEALEAENNLLKAQVSALAVNQEFLEDCLIEVGQVVYA